MTMADSSELKKIEETLIKNISSFDRDKVYLLKVIPPEFSNEEQASDFDKILSVWRDMIFNRYRVDFIIIKENPDKELFKIISEEEFGSIKSIFKIPRVLDGQGRLNLPREILELTEVELGSKVVVRDLSKGKILIEKL